MSEIQYEQYRQIIERIDGVLDNSPDQWQQYLDEARSAMSGLDGLSYFDNVGQLAAQTRAVDILQNLAYHDVDSGGITDIADWCLQKWLKLLQDHPDDVEILKGNLGADLTFPQWKI